MIKAASKVDLGIITNLAIMVREDMLNQGLNQWVGNYPAYDNFYNDYLNNGLFAYFKDNTIIASMSILPEDDLPYREVVWESDKALVIHRIMINPVFQGQGLGKEMISYAIQKARLEDYKAIKIDTHPDNLKMQKMLKSLGFIYRGYLASINRLAYELLV